jgi:hypothetical protein
MSAGFLGRAGALLGRALVSFGLGARRAASATHTVAERDACVTVTLGAVTMITISHRDRC